MTGFASPDIPAHFCYLIVLAVGALVARSIVNQLLSQYPNRWAFAGTLTLFIAYTFVPVGLFWFLDYVGALHDTSLFAALVVAGGYKQIFAGGIQGITLPGQTARLWQPFEAWVKRVGDRVQQQQKVYLDRYTDAVKKYISATPERKLAFKALVSARTRDYDALNNRLKPILALPVEAGVDARVLDALWSELRMSEPDNWGFLLRDQKLIPSREYWWYFKNGRSKLISAALVIGLIAVLWGGLAYVLGGEPERMTTYHHWRFGKTTATEKDRFRTYRALQEQVQSASDGVAGATDQAIRSRIRAALTPLITALRYKDLATRQCDDTLRLIVDVHSPQVDEAIMPDLIDSLRTENAYSRAAIQKVLVGLQKADFAGSVPPEELTKWSPSKDDTPLSVDDYARKWRAWWNAGKPNAT